MKAEIKTIGNPPTNACAHTYTHLSASLASLTTGT